MNASVDQQFDGAFGSLIAPVVTATFFERFFERDVLHVSRGNAAYFAGLYGVGCVEDALVLGANEPDRFTLIKHGASAVALEDMTNKQRVLRFRSARRGSRSVVDPRAVLAAFADGHTLNIRDAGANHPPLAQLCNRIQSQLGFHTRANAYFTPAAAQAFGTHYDTHDTLIAQIEGAKVWQVYDPIVTLPLETQPFSQREHDGKLGTPRTFRLEAGDTLYIPHGFPHDARTSEHRSLHLTFTIAPIRVVDLLDSLVQLAARSEVELRRALPPGWQHDANFAALLSARLATIMPRAIAPDRFRRATESAYNEVFAATGTTAAGIFAALAASEKLGPGSWLQLRDDTPFQLRDGGERLEIALAAKVVTLPASARAGFARLQAGAATFAEIDAVLPAGTAPTFVRTLVLEGLIRIDRVVASRPSDAR